MAYRTRRPLQEAAVFITPQARIDAENIDRLRQQASGRYLSASCPGFYQYSRMAAAPALAPLTRRTISVDEEPASARSK